MRYHLPASKVRTVRDGNLTLSAWLLLITIELAL